MDVCYVLVHSLYLLSLCKNCQITNYRECVRVYHSKRHWTPAVNSAHGISKTNLQTFSFSINFPTNPPGVLITISALLWNQKSMGKTDNFSYWAQLCRLTVSAHTPVSMLPSFPLDGISTWQQECGGPPATTEGFQSKERGFLRE